MKYAHCQNHLKSEAHSIKIITAVFLSLLIAVESAYPATFLATMGVTETKTGKDAGGSKIPKKSRSINDDSASVGNGKKRESDANVAFSSVEKMLNYIFARFNEGKRKYPAKIYANALTEVSSDHSYYIIWNKINIVGVSDFSHILINVGEQYSPSYYEISLNRYGRIIATQCFETTKPEDNGIIDEVEYAQFQMRNIKYKTNRKYLDPQAFFEKIKSQTKDQENGQAGSRNKGSKGSKGSITTGLLAALGVSGLTVSAALASVPGVDVVQSLAMPLAGVVGLIFAGVFGLASVGRGDESKSGTQKYPDEVEISVSKDMHPRIIKEAYGRDYSIIGNSLKERAVRSALNEKDPYKTYSDKDYINMSNRLGSIGGTGYYIEPWRLKIIYDTYDSIIKNMRDEQKKGLIIKIVPAILLFLGVNIFGIAAPDAAQAATNNIVPIVNEPSGLSDGLVAGTLAVAGALGLYARTKKPEFPKSMLQFPTLPSGHPQDFMKSAGKEFGIDLQQNIPLQILLKQLGFTDVSQEIKYPKYNIPYVKGRNVDSGQKTGRTKQFTLKFDGIGKDHVGNYYLLYKSEEVVDNDYFKAEMVIDKDGRCVLRTLVMLHRYWSLGILMGGSKEMLDKSTAEGFEGLNVIATKYEDIFSILGNNQSEMAAIISSVFTEISELFKGKIGDVVDSLTAQSSISLSL